MKRLFVLFAFLLVSCAVFAQDEKPQSEGTLLIVPRLDVDPAYGLGENSWSVDLGTTSFYTFFDGNLGDHFSFSLGNHWLAFSELSFGDTESLYRNSGRAYVNNWVDWANITFSFGGFFVNLGKDYIHFATYEIDAYDHDSHWQINSAMWNNYQVYQWGGRIGWADEDEETKLMLEISSDQTWEKAFEIRPLDQYAYTLYGLHEFGGLSAMASISKCCLGVMGAMGLQTEFGDGISLGIDGYAAKSYYGAALKAGFAPTDHFDLFVKIGYERGDNELVLSGDRFYTGAGCYWYPLRDSQDLRVHGLVSYDNFEQTLGLSLGVTYALNLQLF